MTDDAAKVTEQSEEYYRLAGAYHEILDTVEDLDEQVSLNRTPARAAKAMLDFTSGYNHDPKLIVQGAVFEEKYDDMVVVKNIEFYSLCEHHLLPFFGKCHVGYIPDGKIIGLSKIPRLVDMLARRLQVQERLTSQIAEIIWDCISPEGTGVVIEAQHLCMMMRGVQKQSSTTITNSMLGPFRDEQSCRAEFMASIKG